MSRPTNSTTNYGRALWHLEQAEKEAVPVALRHYHAQAATARALLAQVDSREGRFEGSTWSGLPGGEE